MKNSHASIALNSFGAMFVATSGCSLSTAPFDQAHLHVQIDPRANEAPRELRDTLGLSSSAAVAPPTSASGFDCLGVDVVGPGIPSTNVNDNASVSQRISGLLAGQSCSYPGVTSPPIAAGASFSFSLTVPTGPQRIIQIVGVQANGSASACSSSSLGASEDSSGNKPGYFELGRAVVNLFNDVSVSIPNSYNTLGASAQAARRMNCGDNALPFKSSPTAHQSSLATCPLLTSSRIGLDPDAFSIGGSTIAYVAPLNYSVQDGQATEHPCNASGGRGMWEQYYFDSLGTSLAGAGRLQVSWRGSAGFRGTAPGCATLGSAMTTGQASVFVYRWNGTPGWEQIGTSSSTSLDMISGTTLGAPSDYVASSGQAPNLGAGVVSVGISAGDAGGTMCSQIFTDFVSVRAVP